MLRLYLSPEVRLHIWKTSFSVEGVSTIHTHPWDFNSLVVCGEIKNTRFLPSEDGIYYNNAVILCGPGGGLVEPRPKVKLKELPSEVYVSGNCYQQKASEVHKTEPIDGTVTLVYRKFKSDADHAYVYWECGDWVSAEPRRATNEEVISFTHTALKLL